MFKTVNKAIDWIIEQKRDMGQNRFKNLKKAIKHFKLNNLKTIKKVHIAGTNGKGSTTAFFTQMAINHGTNVGMFVSPYIVAFNERIQINNQPISNNNLLNLINKIYYYQKKVEKEGIHFSFFELSFLIALLYFDQMKVDLMVIEVGIGGLLDTTNVINYDLSLITNIGYDHQHILGNSLDEIFIQKIGIVKPGNMLVTTISNDYMEKINSYLETNQANGYIINPEEVKIKSTRPYVILFEDNEYEISLIGNHQKNNAALAIKAYQIFNPNYNDLLIKLALKETKWPGRMEEVASNIYLDGAHNIDGMAALVNTIKTFFPNNTIKAIYSSLKDKDYEKMLNELTPVVNEVVVTSFPDFRYESLADSVNLNKKIAYNSDFVDTFNQLKDSLSSNEIIIVTGSLHFVGYVKKLFVEGVIK